MYRAILTIAAVLLALTVTPVDAQVLTEPFDNTSQFATSTPFFSDGGWDYFGIAGSAADWGAGTAPSGLKAYTGFTDNFMTGMDLDAEGASLPIVVDWTGLNITGLTGLQFSGDFAEFFDDPGDIDDTDYIHIEYQIDAGGYQNLLWFESTELNGQYNSNFAQDTDFNGVGDGTELGDAALNFAALIPGTGAVLDIRMSVSVNSGDEDFAVDNFLVVDGVPVELMSFSVE